MCGMLGCTNMKKKLKKQAILLRKSGLSYNEIRRKIPVAKSTLSLWLKSIILNREQRKRLYTKQIEILSLGPRSQKQRRAKEVSEIMQLAKKEVKLPLDHETCRLMGAALYWAEGSKGKNLAFTNSDPHLILFFVLWIERIFKIKPEFLKARLNIYPQQNEFKIKKFWSELTKIPLHHFVKSFIKPLSTGYRKNNLYYGTIRIEVPKGTDMRYRIFGWIQAVLSGLDPHVVKTQKQWTVLTKTARPVNLTRSPPIA